MKAHFASVRTCGGPEAIGFEEEDLARPDAGEVLVRHTAIGVNFIDVYHRNGLYPVELPARLGLEAVGIIEAVGDKVERFRPGDRVATFGPARGAYASARVVPESLLLPLPDEIDDRTAASILLKGCTAEFLVERCAKVQPGQIVLVHAASGGVGQLLVQWLKAIGAEVVAAVGSEDKVAAARAAGADHVILVQGDFAARVREIAPGGVAIVLDGVGRATFDGSLRSIARRGLLVSFGNASGPVEAVDLVRLGLAGSVFVTRPVLFDYYADAAERAAGVARLFEMLRQKALRVPEPRVYPLREAARAHADLEARRTTGPLILLP